MKTAGLVNKQGVDAYNNGTILSVGGAPQATFDADTKQEALVSNVNIKTVGGQTLLGTGNIDVTTIATTEEYTAGTSILKATSVKQVTDSLALKSDKATTYTKDEVDAKLTSAYIFRGSVADYAALEAVVDPVTGDVYNVLDTGDNYAWDGTDWDRLAGIVDLSGYALKTELPTKTSELTNDSNFAVDANYVHTDNNFTDAEKTKLGTLVNYDDTEVLADITDLQDTKADKSNTYTKDEVNAKVASVYKFKGTVDDYAALEAIVDPVVGDVYDVLDTGTNYAWDGVKWDSLSGIVDLSNYVTEAPTDGKQYVRKSGAWSAIITTKYAETFTNTDLVGNKITITHGLATEDTVVTVRDNLKQVVLPNLITTIDANSIEIDMGTLAPIDGDYRVVVI